MKKMLRVFLFTLIAGALFIMRITKTSFVVPVITACFVLGLFCRKWQAQVDENAAKQQTDYGMLDIVRYLLAIVVVIVHLRPFLDVNRSLDIFFNNMIGRICVPFFFLVTGYFVYNKERQKEGYTKKYLRSTLSLYLVWSLLYIPVVLWWAKDYLAQGFELYQSYQLPVFIFPFALLLAMVMALLVGLFYIGTYYHLWYFPALIGALWIFNWWQKRYSIKSLLAISFVLLLLGALETYYGIVPALMKPTVDLYFTLFYTTRNFLFFGLFYVTLGAWLASLKSLYLKGSCYLAALSGVLLIVEALFLQGIQRRNSNIMLAPLLIVLFLFLSLIYTSTPKWLTGKFDYRGYYKYYYLIHPFMIDLVALGASIAGFQKLGWLSILLVLPLTHLASWGLNQLKKKYPHKVF